MADVDHPNTHIENDKDAELPRQQPESPKNSGIDPLTEGDTMYPAEDTKAESEKLSEETANDEGSLDEDLNRQADTVEAQSNLGSDQPDETTDAPEGNKVGSLEDRDEPLRKGNERTEPVKADGKVQPQTKTPAKTNDSEVAGGSTEPDADDTAAATGDKPSANAKEAAKNGSGTSAPTAAENDGSDKPSK